MAMGCKEIQEYLLNRPTPAKESADFHAERFAARMRWPT
jgi:EAL domain-containing protein (putative c-di-GMP-specific phosphodiesterase class I)